MSRSPASLHRLLPVVLLLLSGSPSLAVTGWNAPTSRWHDGPVRYLLTPEERDIFQRLGTDRERAAFVEAFWRRRDPTPGSSRNEFLERFTDRLDRAESLRLEYESSRPMWMTDLGKVFLLLGPPADQGDRAAAEPGTVTWTYGQADLEIAFTEDGDGELRLTGAPPLEDATTRGLDPRGERPYALPSPTRVPAAGPPVAALGDSTARVPLGRLMRLTRQSGRSESPADIVRLDGTSETIPIDLRADYYRADDGTTYVTLTLAPGEGAVSAEASRRLIPFGGIVSLDDPSVSYAFDGPDRFAAAGPEAPGTYQTGLGMDPGRYAVLFGLEDPAEARSGIHREDLTVPDLQRGALALSSLTLARSVRALGGDVPGGGTVKVPFVLGRLRVVPRTASAVRNGEEFHVYYQVYGAARGPEGKPHFDVEYRFAGRHGNEWVEIGAPIRQVGLAREAQAWSFPMQGWPPGAFRLTVTVSDRVSSHTVSKETAFRVLD